jgi:hypothetical protein
MKNVSWRTLFLCVIAACTIGYTCYTATVYWEFAQLDREILLENVKWDIFSKDEETHLFKASYS